MSTTNKIKFYRRNSAPANPQEGYIWFNSSNGVLAIYKDSNWEYYSGLVDATYTNKKLTITKKDGTDKVEVDLGDLMNSEITSQLNKLDATVWSTGGTTAPDFKTDANKNKRVAVKVVQADGKITGVEVLENDIATATSVGEVNNRIDVLVSEGDGSIKDIATDVLAQYLVDPNNTNKNYDTLVEMSEWLKSHPDNAAKMNETLNSLKGVVDNLPEQFVTKFGGKTGEITIKGDGTDNGSVNLKMNNNQLQASIVGLNSAAYAATSAFDAAGSAEASLTAAKAYADNLLSWVEY